MTSLNVLVVEDDRPTRLLLERMISGRGHDVCGCESAEEAFDLLAQTFFPLIVLDTGLPGMNGLDFIHLLRKHPRGKSIFVLVGTGNNRPDDLKEILDAGANDYIGKPYHPGLLDVRLAVAEAAVKNITERRRMENDLDNQPMTKNDGKKLKSELLKWMVLFWITQLAIFLWFRTKPLLPR